MPTILQDMSLVSGSTSELLWSTSLGALAERQAEIYGDRTAIVFPWQNDLRRTYVELYSRSKVLSKALIVSGLQHGDCVGIFAGNCCAYIEIFLAAASVGCPVVVLNCSYTPTELEYAIAFSECKLLCISQFPGPNRDSTPHLDALRQNHPDLQLLLLDDGGYAERGHSNTTSFPAFFSLGQASDIPDVALLKRTSAVRSCDVLNYQFTSGTTGAPKAAMLTHTNLINNGRFTAKALALRPHDVICCPPPLFHCFGLVMGFLGAFTTGCSIVFPSQQFDAHAVVEAMYFERCTILYGVPTMLGAELDALAKSGTKLKIRTALAAGSLVPAAMVRRLTDEMGVESVLIAYGMTETSPVTFATSAEDSLEQRLSTVGKVFPHTGAKIIDVDGNIVPHGVRGEICTRGYALQRGYLKNDVKTREAMRTDADGEIWMHTGDEGVINSDGYCRVTGRIKDLIIRGGENIAPTEIEERLLGHESISEAAVVGIPHSKYGEQIVAFVRHAGKVSRPGTTEIGQWVRETLARHKTPEHVLWIGDKGVGEDYPKTASGKHQKHILRDIAVALLQPKTLQARL